MKQFTYSYETVRCDLSGWGGFGGNIYEIANHRAVIDKKAAAGWRYVGFIPKAQRGTGHIEEMDLIFEKEVQ